MTPTESPRPLGFGWTCPTCGRDSRAYDFLCRACWTPRPLLPGMPSATALLTSPFWETVVLPRVEATILEASQTLPAFLIRFETQIPRFFPAVRRWGDRLPTLIDDTSPQAQVIAGRLFEAFETFLPRLERATTQWQRYGPSLDAAAAQRLETVIQEVLGLGQGILDRWDDLTTRSHSLESFRRYGQRLMDSLAQLSKPR